MNLGTFTKDENGVLSGTAATLTLSFDLDVRPIEQVGGGPQFRVYRRGTDIEVGFARQEFGKRSGKSYLNMLIDSPEFPQAIWTALVREEDGSYQLKWSRPRRSRKAANGPLQAEAAANF